MVVRPPQTMTIRYRNAAEIAQTAPDLISWERLTRLLVAVSSETTSAIATPLFNAVRIKHIDFWASNVQISGTFPSTLESIRVVWDGTAISNRYGIEPREVLSAYGNANFPAKLRVRPPRNTLSGMWVCNANITAVASLWVEVLPINSVMDITFEYILADFTEVGGSTENFSETTLTSAEVGGVYAVFPSASGIFTAQGWEMVDISSIPLKMDSATPSVASAASTPALDTRGVAPPMGGLVGRRRPTGQALTQK